MLAGCDRSPHLKFFQYLAETALYQAHGSLRHFVPNPRYCVASSCYSSLFRLKPKLSL